MGMDISSFEDLLTAARMQVMPQRLLFVFSGVELPDDSTPEQQAGFEAGEGGALVPLMCVDKSLSELSDFKALVTEADQQGPASAWQIVFVAAMSGQLGATLTSKDAEIPLQRMEEAIRQGAHGSFIPFDRHGQPVVFG